MRPAHFYPSAALGAGLLALGAGLLTSPRSAQVSWPRRVRRRSPDLAALGAGLL